MPITDGDLSGIRNKIVRGALLAKQKREKAQAKLKKRIARKEAENRGEVVERGLSSLPSFSVSVLLIRISAGFQFQDTQSQSRTRKNGWETLKNGQIHARVQHKLRWMNSQAT